MDLKAFQKTLKTYSFLDEKQQKQLLKDAKFLNASDRNDILQFLEKSDQKLSSTRKAMKEELVKINRLLKDYILNKVPKKLKEIECDECKVDALQAAKMLKELE